METKCLPIIVQYHKNCLEKYLVSHRSTREKTYVIKCSIVIYQQKLYKVTQKYIAKTIRNKNFSNIFVMTFHCFVMAAFKPANKRSVLRCFFRVLFQEHNNIFASHQGGMCIQQFHFSYQISLTSCLFYLSRTRVKTKLSRI